MYAKLSERVRVQEALATATFSTATNGPTFDTQADGNGYRVAALAFTGLLGATATMTIVVQESDDNSVWSDVSGATFNLTNAHTGETLIADVACAGRKRYLRARVTTAANSPSGNAVWIAGDPRTNPVDQPQAVMFQV